MRNKQILNRKDFIKRVLKFALFSISLVFISLFLGMLGYHYIAGLSWIDSFYNASMILAGMGPVNEMVSSGAKVFESFYAIYSGLIFLTSVAIFFSPIAHRLMHILKIEED